MDRVQLPALRHALPVRSEAFWSNMLAALIETDPLPLATTLGLPLDVSTLRVHREVAIDRANRPDIVLTRNGNSTAVIEIKVLSGLGNEQLARYQAAEPDAEAYALIYPERLGIGLSHAQPWQGLTWETVLSEYARSDNAWVATTARAWLNHLDVAIPKLGPDTIWSDLRLGEDFVIAVHARMSWLFNQIPPKAGVEQRLVLSSSGVSPVVLLYADTSAPGYTITVEIEENLPVRSYPKYVAADGRRLLGPSAKVLLCQEGVTTSAGFDWDYLLRLWPVMEQARSDWVHRAARPKAIHDRMGYDRIVRAGAPPFLGIGFGEAQTRINGVCMFGARIQFPAEITLGKLSDEIAELGDLTLDLARVI